MGMEDKHIPKTEASLGLYQPQRNNHDVERKELKNNNNKKVERGSEEREREEKRKK